MLRQVDIDRPRPGPGECLVRVCCTSVTAGDAEIRSSSLPWLFWVPIRLWLGLFKPKPGLVPGMEFSGEVVELGEGPQRFAVGDAVFGASGMGFGAYAEYLCVPAESLVIAKPEALSFEDAAGVAVGGLAAFGYLRKGGVETANKVLIRGASGSIGTFAVQLAKRFGAEVTGVCGPDGVERVRGLGADRVLDYTQADFTDTSERYDLILDVVGRMPVRGCMDLLTAEGAYVRGTIPGFVEVLLALWYRVSGAKRFVVGDAGDALEDLTALGTLLGAGEVTSVVDRVFALEDIVEAHRYVDGGHKQGHVIVRVGEDSS